MNLNIKRTLKKLWCRDDGLAALEAALVFPLLLTMLVGVYDTGNAIIANTKLVHASQTVADLVTRTRSVSTADVNEAIEAGKLALEPMSTTTFGVDIASIAFDSSAHASVNWRKTQNMTADPTVLNRVTDLADENSGVVVVIVKYTYHPFFVGFITGDIHMSEVAFARGRKSAVVTHS